MSRTIVIEVETDSEDSLNFIKRDIEQELSCCSTYFDSIKITERKVGEWECSDDIFEYALCSCCKWDSGEALEYALKRFRFCPNCGARMKGEEDE